MSWFRKDPPPPPPKKGIPGWVSITTPIVFAVVLGLLGLVYNGLAEELKTKADKEATLQQIQTNQRILEKHQQSLEETLKVITQIQAEREAQEKYKLIAPPSGVSIGGKADSGPPPLSPADFQQYMKMSPSDRAAFRKLHPSYESLPK